MVCGHVKGTGRKRVPGAVCLGGAYWFWRAWSLLGVALSMFPASLKNWVRLH